MRFHRLALPVLALALLSGAAPRLAAQTLTPQITFGSASDFDTNFLAKLGAGAVVWNASGYLRDGSSTSTVETYLYNPGATNTGTVGNGGNTAASSSTTFGSSLSIQADFTNTPGTYNSGTNSFGYYTNLNASGLGYAALFRPVSASSFDFRLFDATSNIATGGVGNQIGGSGNTVVIALTGGHTFSNSSSYTYQLVESVTGANSLSFTVNLYSGSTLWGTGTITDTSASAAFMSGGQVGLRIGQFNQLQIDNFAVQAVPEPSELLLLLLGGGACLLLAARRRAAVAA